MPSRNTETHFTERPHAFITRSKFGMDWTHKTTFNAGDLFVIHCDADILPADTWSINMSAIVRMTTPLKPIMDNLYLETYAFLIPHRLVYEHWEELNGENKDGVWTQETEYSTPMMTTPDGGATINTIMNYCGIPIGVSNLSFNALPIRAYIKVFNDWFRPQAVMAPYPEYTDDTTRQASNTVTYLGGACAKISKFHDYFTSAAPEPQKGSAVTLPLGTTAPISFKTSNSELPSATELTKIGGYNLSGTTVTKEIGSSLLGFDSQGNSAIMGGATYARDIYVAGYADLTNATAATINALRIAATVQQIYERDVHGTRYTEILRNHFSVISPDARLQRPEYLGGKRIPINIQQVIQNSETSENNYLGTTGAMSITADSDHLFTKSMTEHCILLVLGAIRQDHSYQQGLERQWKRGTRLDYYWPLMANLGYQPIYNYEIMAQGTEDDNGIFGYIEHWAEYRYKNSRISGEFLSTYSAPLDSWHLGDYYEDLPVLSTEFIQETDEYVNRVIAVDSSVQNQFIADFYFHADAVRPMPIYSVPGIDRL